MIKNKLNYQFRDIWRNSQFKSVSGTRAINNRFLYYLSEEGRFECDIQNFK